MNQPPTSTISAWETLKLHFFLLQKCSQPCNTFSLVPTMFLSLLLNSKKDWSQPDRVHYRILLIHICSQLYFKGTVSPDLQHYQKTPPGPRKNRQQRFREIFCFRKDIREKDVSRIRWLSGHRVRKVNDYTDRTKTTPTLSENFEGFSQILKE